MSQDLEYRIIRVSEEEIQEALQNASHADRVDLCRLAVQRSFGTPWHESPVRGVLLEDVPPCRALIVPFSLIPDIREALSAEQLKPFEFEAMICMPEAAVPA